MAERDWEAMAAARLRRTIDTMVSRLRDTAAQIEREARYNLESAAKPKRDMEFQTYARVATAAIQELHNLVFNANATNIIDAAADAEQARQEMVKVNPPDVVAAKRAALGTVLTTLDGWIEGAQDNHDALGHRGENTGGECWRRYAPEDIRAMVNDAAREVRVSTFPTPKNAQEDVR